MDRFPSAEILGSDGLQNVQKNPNPQNVKFKKNGSLPCDFRGNSSFETNLSFFSQIKQTDKTIFL